MKQFRRLTADLDSQVWVISLMTLVIMMGSSVISPVLPLLAQEFGVSYAGAGVLVAAFAVGRIPFDFIGGTLVDRLSPRLIAGGGATIVTLSAVLSAFAESFSTLLWYRLMSGVGSALFTITAMAFLVRSVAPQRMGQVMSFYQSMLLIGVSVGPSVGGFAASLFHSLHAPFWAMAILSLVVTVLCFRLIGEFPVSPTLAHARGSHHVLTNAGLSTLLRDQTFLFVCVLTFLIFAIRSGLMLNLMPLFAQTTIGLGETGIGIVQSLCSLANFFVLWHAGQLLDRVGRRRVTLPSLWATVVVILLFPWATTLLPLVGASVAFGIVIGYLGPAPAAIIADIAPKNSVGTVMGIYRMAGDIGLLLGPIAVGWAAGHVGFGAAFSAVAGCTAVVAVMGMGTRETLTAREVKVETVPTCEEGTS
jgi:MFS family permease